MDFYLALLVLAVASAQGSALANIEHANVDPADIVSYLEGLQEELEASDQNNTRLQEIINDYEERINQLDIYARLASLEHKVTEIATLSSK